MKITRPLLFMFCMTITWLYCQDSFESMVNKIKTNPEYLWGQERAKNKSDARSLAEEDLLSKIQISLSFVNIDEQSEVSLASGDIVSTEKYTSKHKSVTSLNLKGLKRFERKKLWKWDVFSYIHLDSVKSSFNLRKRKIIGFVNTGNEALKNNRVGEALRNFYWGYLLASVYPDTINFNINNNTDSNYPSVVLMNLLKTTFEDVSFNDKDCYRDGFAIMVPMTATYQEKPISELLFNYYSGMGTDYAIMEDGFAELPIYDEPTVAKRKLSLNLDYIYEIDMRNDQEILSLYEVLDKQQFNNIKSININFPWLRPDYVADESDFVVNTEAIDVLLQHKSTKDFINILDQYGKLGKLKFGKKSDFGNGDSCFVAIADKFEVSTLLYHSDNAYFDLINQKRYTELSSHFKGKTQIWIKEIDLHTQPR